MKNLIIHNNQAPGDIVMLTAAIRDLHKCYPGEFITDVRTSSTDLWLNNPYITKLSKHSKGVKSIQCHYPLIHQSNGLPYHFIHGFIQYLNEQLNINIKPTAFKGDIHLSDEEKQRSSIVHEITGNNNPYWVIVSGGKYDFTAKWWSPERYQQVVDYFKGKIQFVQVGEDKHHHPALNNVIDLRTKTTLRQLILLMHHAQGVVTPVSLLMHLAAAVESGFGIPKLRPCVVIAGGREAAHWEEYPGHRFLHTIGQLKCCETGGCWKSRVKPLGDGDAKDNKENLCVDVVGNLPHCLDMISSERVIQEIESYFSTGMIEYLNTQKQLPVTETKIIASNSSTEIKQTYIYPASLTEATALQEMNKYIQHIPEYPATYKGRGIVICGGGKKYFTNAWVLVNMLRYHKCNLPIQIWYLEEKEMSKSMADLVKPLGVLCVDGLKVREKNPARVLKGWELKAYSILHSPFKEVLLLDADNIPLINPELIFDWKQYHETGAVFWPDIGRLKSDRRIWSLCNVQYKDEPEFESGQILIDKEKCWKALNLTMWLNEYSDLYYRYIHGDKETFHMAFRKLQQQYSMTRYHVILRTGVMYQHDLNGNIIFQHRNSYKWEFYGNNPKLPGFQYEDKCLAYLDILRNLWDGIIGNKEKKNLSFKSETERQFLSTAWTYERVGYGKRPMTFLRNGFIGTGRGGCETNWELIEENKTTLLNISGNDGLICSLRLDENKKHWQGQWLKHEQMPIIISSLNS
jgi:ADP-heptose:LPS heptosyltransferase